MEEIWKDIPGYEGYYQVSSLGKVKSSQRVCNHNYGGKRTVSDRILKSSGKIYPKVVLSKNNIKISFLVHRLVAKCFIDNPYSKSEINHINGIKSDNYYRNLEWCDRSENEQHAYDHGFATTHSDNHHSAKLKNTDIPIIRKRISEHHKIKIIALDYGVSIGAISAIKHNRKWNHIK